MTENEFIYEKLLYGNLTHVSNDKLREWTDEYSKKEAKSSETLLEDIIKQFNIKKLEEKVKEEEECLDKIFKDINDNIKPDELQKKVIAFDDDHLLVCGGAGTGKTTAIVGKIKYLIEHKNVAPNQILVLSFANATCDDICKGIKAFQANECVEGKSIISTVDKFAKEVLELNKKFVISTAKIYKIVNDYLCDKYDEYSSKSEFKNLIRPVTYNFKNLDKYKGFKLLDSQSYVEASDWEKRTLNGEEVASKHERLIADFLLLNGIEYEYEKLIDTGEIILKPDFCLKKGGEEIYLEYFGVKGNNEYAQNIEKKKASYNKSKIKCIFIEATPLKFTQQIVIDALLKEGIKPSDNVDFEKIKRRLSLREFTEFMVKCINDYSAVYKNDDNLEEKELSVEGENRDFIKLLRGAYNEYKQKRGSIRDFNDVIHEVTVMLKTECNQEKYLEKFNIKYLFIDEFQDLSNIRMKFIQQILKLNNPVCILSKDDVQCGIPEREKKEESESELIIDVSEIGKFNFENNFRCKKEVYEVAKAFVQKKKDVDIIGEPCIFLCEYDEKNIYENIATILEAEFLGQSEDTKEVLITGMSKNDIKSIEEENIKDLLNDGDGLLIDQIKNIKGVTKDIVFILDLEEKTSSNNKGNFAELYNMVIGSVLNGDDNIERKLFYVGLTRSRGNIYLFSNRGSKSKYFEELKQYKNVVQEIQFHETDEKETDSEEQGKITELDDERWREIENVQWFEKYRLILDAYKSMKEATGLLLGKERFAAFLVGDNKNLAQMKNYKSIRETLEKVSFYGYYSGFSRDIIERKIQEILEAGYFRYEQKGYYKLLAVDDNTYEDLEFDCELFNRLKIERRKIVIKEGWPPKKGAWDIPLRDIVYYKPKTKEDFIKEVEAYPKWHRDHGDRFFNVLQDFMKNHKSQKN